MSTPAQDADHLRVLSILYYVWGGLTAAFTCLGGVYMLIAAGVIAATAPHGDAPPLWVGGIFAAGIGLIFVLVITVAVLTIWTGRCLAQRRHYVFCSVIAALTCLSFPFGTALGVFTIIVLVRPSVKAMFQSQSRSRFPA